MLAAEFLTELGPVFARCQHRFPTINIGYDTFCARVEEILAAGHVPHVADGKNPCAVCLQTLKELHHEDLFLAVACSHGDRIAWEFFADEFLPMMQRFAAHASHHSDAAQDLAQDLLSSLLGDPSPDSTPRKGKLAGYNGRGSLGSWLRTAVAHAAIDRFRRGRKQVSLDEMMDRGDPPPVQQPDSGTTTEEHLDARWGPVLVRSLEKEIARLEARDRLLLTLYYVQGVPLKAIGTRFGVHEATVSRWLERIRADVRKRVEREMQKVHRLKACEVSSVWRWIAETGDAALETVLRPLSGPAQKKMQGRAVESSTIGVGNE